MARKRLSLDGVEDHAAQGMSYQQIADAIGATYQQVYMYCARHRIECARPMRNSSAISELAAKGLNHQEIAQTLGVNTKTVQLWGFRNGISIPGPRDLTHGRHDEVARLASEGLTTQEIGRATGYCFGAVSLILRKRGIKAARKPHAKGLQDAERAERMASMYRQGLTLEKIGEHFVLTRERVRQIIKASGIDCTDRARDRKAETAKAMRLVRREAEAMRQFGVSYADRQKYRASGLMQSFKNQRNAAHTRGIEWGLIFRDWLTIWEASGKLELRGRGKGRYVMSRINDGGGYVFGNVHIQLSTDNNSQGIKKCRANKAKYTGVWLLYPGLSKPWIAKHGQHEIGRYRTEEQAAKARARYVERNADKLRLRGRGYSRIRCKDGYHYQVIVAGKYIGTFPTTEAALAAREAAVSAAARFGADQELAHGDMDSIRSPNFSHANACESA